MRPASIAPAEITIVGTLRRPAAIRRPGTFLSQAATKTRPSNGCAVAIVSTLSAINSRETSEYFIPTCPIARPSQTAIAGKTIGVPPPMATPVFTASVILSKNMCPGTMSFWDETIPISGRAISASESPRAFRIARCGAAAGPCVSRSLRMGIVLFLGFAEGKNRAREPGVQSLPEASRRAGISSRYRTARGFASGLCHRTNARGGFQPTPPDGLRRAAATEAPEPHRSPEAPRSTGPLC